MTRKPCLAFAATLLLLTSASGVTETWESPTEYKNMQNAIQKSTSKSLYRQKVESTKIAIDKIMQEVKSVCESDWHAKNCMLAIKNAKPAIQYCVQKTFLLPAAQRQLTTDCLQKRDFFDAWLKTNKPQ
jgi:hypothetical protein